MIIEKERLFKCLYYADMPDDNKQFIQDLIDNQGKEIDRLTAESTEWESKCYDLQERFDNLMEAHKICDEDNERLNNIINELEKIINDYQIASELDSDYKLIYDLKNKIKELKEGK